MKIEGNRRSHDKGLKIISKESSSRSYLSWNKEMDDALAKALYDQMNAGNKADGDWKPQAYQAVVDKINATLKIGLTKANVKNRLKSWKRHYGVITDIKSQSGLVWDEEKKMVPITAENLDIWNAYVEEELHQEELRQQPKEE